MPDFDTELPNCLALILGEPVPAAVDDPLRFYRQWLAERNLGLVPIAGAAGFDWPGMWLARVRAGDADHAVVMFGSPSGPMHDPGNAFAVGGVIEEGWLLARLDLRLPIEHPYAGDRLTGSVAGILVAAAAEGPLSSVET